MWGMQTEALLLGWGGQVQLREAQLPIPRPRKALGQEGQVQGGGAACEA